MFPFKYPAIGQRLSRLDLVLLLTLCFVALVYAFYFLFLPQSWGLMDDYAFALHWGKPGFHPFTGAKEFLEGLMAVGRFRPMDALARGLRFTVLPVTPRAFHAGQFGLAVVALVALAAILKRFGLTTAQILFGVLLACANLAMKDWLVYTTAAESLAMSFLLVSVALYIHDRKWVAAFIFILAVLSKETFFAFAGLFVLLEAIARFQHRRISYAPAMAILVFAIGFIFFVRSLPQLYTAGISPAHLTFQRLAQALTLPLIKSFAPALALVAYDLVRYRPSLKDYAPQLPLLSIGLSIAIGYTILLAIWGPFDSWFYLHIPIPFGWAMLLAALWRPNMDRAKAFLLGLTLIYLSLSVLNGSRNVWSFFDDAKIAAAIACEDAARVPGLKIYSNCNEGSFQLQNYLTLNQVCPNPPKFNYLPESQPPAGPDQVYELVISSKCDDVNLNQYRFDHVIRFGTWTVAKHLGAAK